MTTEKKLTPEALAALIAGEAPPRPIANPVRKKEKVAEAVVVPGSDADEWLWQRKLLSKKIGKSNPERMLNERPVHRILWERMEPGSWYAFEDMRALLNEYAHGTVRWVTYAMLKRGTIERKPRTDGRTRRQPRQKGTSYFWRRVEGF